MWVWWWCWRHITSFFEHVSFIFSLLYSLLSVYRHHQQQHQHYHQYRYGIVLFHLFKLQLSLLWRICFVPNFLRVKECLPSECQPFPSPRLLLKHCATAVRKSIEPNTFAPTGFNAIIKRQIIPNHLIIFSKRPLKFGMPRTRGDVVQALVVWLFWIKRGSVTCRSCTTMRLCLPGVEGCGLANDQRSCVFLGGIARVCAATEVAARMCSEPFS